MLSTSFMSLNAFLRMLLYLLQLNIIWTSFSISFYFTIFANFYVFGKIILRGGVYCEVMRWQPYFSYGVPIIEVMQIYISFLFKEFLCLWKKVILFIFINVKQGLDTTVLSSFLENLVLVLRFLRTYFII